MKRTKRIFILTLLLAALLLAAACSSRQEDSGLVKQTPEPATDAPANKKEPTAEPTFEPTPEPTPEPTLDPTQEAKKERPSDEWFIEQTWPVAQRVGEIHGFKPDRGTAYVVGDGYDVYVMLRESDSDGAKGVGIGFKDHSHNNEFAVEMRDSMLLFPQAYGEDTAQAIDEWWERWEKQRIVVTPEDIINAGCTETEGDEYMQTVAKLCAERMAELLTGAPEGFPARCIKAAPARCGYVEMEYKSGYGASIAFIPEDPLGFDLFFDKDMTLFEDEAYPELWGRCSYGGILELEREGDNWIAGASFYREGR